MIPQNAARGRAKALLFFLSIAAIFGLRRAGKQRNWPATELADQ